MTLWASLRALTGKTSTTSLWPNWALTFDVLCNLQTKRWGSHRPALLDVHQNGQEHLSMQQDRSEAPSNNLSTFPHFERKNISFSSIERRRSFLFAGEMASWSCRRPCEIGLQLYRVSGGEDDYRRTWASQKFEEISFFGSKARLKWRHNGRRNDHHNMLCEHHLIPRRLSSLPTCVGLLCAGEPPLLYGSRRCSSVATGDGGKIFDTENE